MKKTNKKASSPERAASNSDGCSPSGNDGTLFPPETVIVSLPNDALKKIKPKKKKPTDGKHPPRAGNGVTLSLPKGRSHAAFASKREMAKLLYTKNDLTIAAIAQRVGVTEKTLSGWAKEGEWASYKKNLITTKDEALQFFMEQLNSLNNAIKQRPEGARYADSKEADIFVKLTASINNLLTETAVGQIIEVAKLFIDSIPDSENELIITITKYFDALIKDKLKRR